MTQHPTGQAPHRPQADLQLWLGGLAVSEQPRGAVAHLQTRRGLPGEFLCPSQGVQPWGATSDPGRGGGEVLRSVCTRDAHSRISDSVKVLGTHFHKGHRAAGLSKEPDTTRAPRVRTAFTVEQVSTLERSFQHRRYLGPLERRTLAREMRLSEVQIKTWFQNRRMKHKRQLQDSQLKVPFSGALYTPLASCPPPSALGDSLQLLYPWASLPGPPALVQPPGFFWGPCQMEQASLPSAWASCSGQPLTCCLPDPGGQVHMLGLALSWGPWGLCALPDIGDAF
nr:homeobox protein VENTX isoform X1 [Equus asinus]